MVEDGAESVGDGVSELAAFVEGPGRLGSGVGTDASREGELLEESLHPALVLGDVGVDLGVDALEVGLGEDGGSAMA
jgi:hypothetical protein